MQKHFDSNLDTSSQNLHGYDIPTASLQRNLQSAMSDTDSISITTSMLQQKIQAIFASNWVNTSLPTPRKVHEIENDDSRKSHQVDNESESNDDSLSDSEESSVRLAINKSKSHRLRDNSLHRQKKRQQVGC